MESSSPRWKVNLVDFYKSIRGGVIVFLAAASPVFVENLKALIFADDMTLDPARLITAVKIASVSTLMELCRRYMVSYESSR